jgi:NAD(P)-dependent dehydrogenase (short-subunit alcohol dehydrogenase family)
MAGIVEGKVALVTGAAGGIGRAAAQIFAREGARVVVADLQEAAGAETVKLIQEAGGEATFVRCDVSKGADVENLVKATVSKYGRLDCAYNNAGVEGTWTRIHECTEENFDFNYNVNLKGVFLCIKYQVRQFLEQGGPGAIVSTASIAGLVGSKNAGAYVAAKHGVVGLTKTAALEYAAKGIRVNAVCPGVIRTPMLERMFATDPRLEQAMIGFEPIGRFGVPGEIGEAAVWLCSDQASFVTGHAMVVDGGATAC